MNLTYRGITMRICKFHNYKETAVYTEDGVDYLYTHYHIDVECVFHNFATGSEGGIPVDTRRLDDPTAVADLPAVSERTLREYLKQPRGRLIVTVGQTVLLRSPLTLAEINEPYSRRQTAADLLPTAASDRDLCDVKNGPRPIHIHVTRFVGETSFHVRFAIETWLREDLGNLSPMISNRWRVSETLDQDAMSTLHVNGVVVFRADALRRLGLEADQFRRRFMFLPVGGFQRQEVKVEVDSTGLVAKYSFIDRQQVWTLRRNRHITRFSGYTVASVGTQGWAGVVGGIGQEIGQNIPLVGGAAGGAVAGQGGGNFGAAFGFLGNILNMGGNAVNRAGQLLPQSIMRFHIELWGTRVVTRLALIQYAIEILFRVKFWDTNDGNRIHHELIVDFPNRHVQLTGTLEANGIIGQNAAAMAEGGGILPPLDGAAANLAVLDLSGARAPVENLRPRTPRRAFMDFRTPFWSVFEDVDGATDETVRDKQFVWPSHGTRGFRAVAADRNGGGGAAGDVLSSFGEGTTGARPYMTSLLTQALAAPLPHLTDDRATNNVPTPANAVVFRREF